MSMTATCFAALGALLTLENPRTGMRVTFSDDGARFVAVEVRDRAGALRTVTAPPIDPFSGATLGRVANRIADSRFTMDGKTYELPSNEAPNGRKCLLHGGAKGFYRQKWQMRKMSRDGVPGVVFSRRSPDGEEGFPGNVDVTVTCLLTDANALRIEYEAKTDRATPVQMTNHGYFNLNGDPKMPIDNHVLWVAGDEVTDVGLDLIPLPGLRKVSGTEFDFSVPTEIGKRLSTPGNYARNFCLSDRSARFKRASTLYSPSTGIRMETWTTEIGLQIYMGHKLKIPRSYITMEPQHWPDSVNRPDFPPVILRPGETYRAASEYRFSVIPACPSHT